VVEPGGSADIGQDGEIANVAPLVEVGGEQPLDDFGLLAFLIGQSDLLFTGYTTEQVSWDLESPFHLIHKPVSQARLFQEVSSCLAASKLSEHRNGRVFS
jgi:hypothetical protein